MSQMTLTSEVGLSLTDIEQDYLVKCQVEADKTVQKLDVEALKKIGLLEQEINYLKKLWEFEFEVDFGASNKVFPKDDLLTYLIWEIKYLPRIDKETGDFTKESYIKSTCPSWNSNFKKVDDLKYWNGIRLTLMRELRDNPQDIQKFVLFRIFKKIVFWCDEFERDNNIKDENTEAQGCGLKALGVCEAVGQANLKENQLNVK